jgi:signal peptidase I
MKDELCIKRIIGLPGDRIEFKMGRLVLNGAEAQIEMQGDFGLEIVEGGRWLIWPDQAIDFNLEPVVVPPGMLYLLNDRRADHLDSRTWGVVSQGLLQSRVRSVWLSLDWQSKDGDLDSTAQAVSDWPRVRWSRIFHSIH